MQRRVNYSDSFRDGEQQRQGLIFALAPASGQALRANSATIVAETGGRWRNALLARALGLLKVSQVCL